MVLRTWRYRPLGERGKLCLDRIPEAQQWSGALIRDWMAMFPESAGVFYIDGHVRVHHSSQTELHRQYVARQQLCLRATTDYWVNTTDGQPFYMVSRPVDPGLLLVLEEEIFSIIGKPDGLHRELLCALGLCCQQPYRLQKL